MPVDNASRDRYWSRLAIEEERWHQRNMDRYAEQRRAAREANDALIRADPRYTVGQAPILYVADPIPTAALVAESDVTPIAATTASFHTIQSVGNLSTGEYVFYNPRFTWGTNTTTTIQADSTYLNYQLRSAQWNLNAFTNGVAGLTTTLEGIGGGLEEWAAAFGTQPEHKGKSPRKKAKRLLYSCLTEYQKRMYRKHRYFHVVSESGKKYRLRHGDVMNVYLLEGKKPVKKYCIHPSNVPVEDTLLAQKLLLETDEKAFLKIANESQIYEVDGYDIPAVVAA